MEVCRRRIYPRWICPVLIVVRLCSCVFGLDPFDLSYSSSAAVFVLVHWSYGALARKLPDCLLQEVVSNFVEGGAMMAVRLRLASVLVVVARWSMDMDVNFIISVVHCPAKIEDGQI